MRTKSTSPGLPFAMLRASSATRSALQVSRRRQYVKCKRTHKGAGLGVVSHKISPVAFKQFCIVFETCEAIGKHNLALHLLVRYTYLSQRRNRARRRNAPSTVGASRALDVSLFAENRSKVQSSIHVALQHRDHHGLRSPRVVKKRRFSFEAPNDRRNILRL